MLCFFEGCKKDIALPVFNPFFLTYQGNGDLIGRDILTGGNTNIAVCGYGIGNNADQDFFIINLDSSGNELSRRFSGTSGNDQCWSFTKANDGGFIITGWTDINDPGVSNDVLIVKTDAEGNQQWSKIYGGVYNDLSTDIVSTGDGYIVSAILGSSADENIWVLRLNNSGDTLWTFAYGGNQNDGAMSVASDGAGTYGITGYTNSSGNGSTDGFLLLMNNWGQMLAYHPFGTSDYEEPHDIERTSWGWAVCGHAGTANDINTHDFFLQFLNENGDDAGFYTYGGDSHDGAEAMTFFENHYYVVGRSSSADPDQDVLFLKTDESSNREEMKWMGTPNEDPAYGIYVDHWQVLITGYAVNPTSGRKDVLVIRK